LAGNENWCTTKTTAQRVYKNDRANPKGEKGMKGRVKAKGARKKKQKPDRVLSGKKPTRHREERGEEGEWEMRGRNRPKDLH